MFIFGVLDRTLDCHVLPSFPPSFSPFYKDRKGKQKNNVSVPPSHIRKRRKTNTPSIPPSLPPSITYVVASPVHDNGGGHDGFVQLLVLLGDALRPAFVEGGADNGDVLNVVPGPLLWVEKGEEGSEGGMADVCICEKRCVAVAGRLGYEGR